MSKDTPADIRSIIDSFVNQVVAVVEADNMRRMQAAIAATFSGPLFASQGLAGFAHSVATVSAPRRQRSKQLCPVPGCTGVAAPVFGMVCAKHKDMPRARIAEYRSQRRATKAGG